MIIESAHHLGTKTHSIRAGLTTHVNIIVMYIKKTSSRRMPSRGRILISGWMTALCTSRGGAALSASNAFGPATATISVTAKTAARNARRFELQQGRKGLDTTVCQSANDDREI